MPRKVQPRQSYLNDALWLRRTIEAVKLDTKAEPAWKAAAIQHLTEALKLFVNPVQIAGQTPLSPADVDELLGNQR